LTLLDQRKALVGKLDDWNGLRQAQQAKAQAIDAYVDDVQTLADALSIAAGSLEVREQALWSALEQARARQTRQDQARADLTDESERVSRLQATLAQVERRVADAVSASGSADEAALKTLLANLKLQRDIDTEIERLRKTLHAPARGEPIDSFIERVRAEAPDQLTAERDTPRSRHPRAGASARRRRQAPGRGRGEQARA
jgi:chromosome segregation ATPase